MMQKRGHSRWELIVSALLLTSMISIASAAFTRLKRVWDSTHSFQLASQELSNHLERLTVLSHEECREYIASMVASERLQETIPGCSLRGELHQESDTVRVVLTVHSDDIWLRQPVILVGWLEPEESQ
jgi:hypothetical protein